MSISQTLLKRPKSMLKRRSGRHMEPTRFLSNESKTEPSGTTSGSSVAIAAPGTAESEAQDAYIGAARSSQADCKEIVSRSKSDDLFFRSLI